MVRVPPLPSQLPQCEVEQEVKRPAHAVRMGEVFEALDMFNAEQLGEVYSWLAEHPMPGMNPVQLAMASVNALNEHELLLFFEALKASIDEQLWKMLTG